MKAVETSPEPGPVRRWGPLVAVLGAVALLAVLVVTTDAESDDEVAATDATTSTAGEAEGPELPEGVMSFSVAEEQDIVDDIDWGERCDTDTGVLALPLSPPPECFAPFQGDNGGATTRGVTGDTIKVVVYQAQPNDPVLSFIYSQIGLLDTNEDIMATYEGFLTLFEQYYETYGRQVELIPYVATGAATDEVAATADAETIARDIEPFMVFGGPSLGSAFGDTLAANDVMCVSCVPSTANDFYTERAPYVWAISSNADQTRSMVADYVVNRLAGRKAEHGGDAVADEERRFGYIYLSTNPEAEAARERFEERLADSGVSFADVASFTDPLSLAGQAREILARMKDLGVTTVVYSGDPLAPQTLAETATQQDYYPEWVLGGSALVDTTLFGRTYDQEQWQHAFGPSGLFARVDPSVAGSSYLYEWFWGEQPPAQQSALIAPSLQFLLGVLQGLGTEVTPERFQSAIFASGVDQGDVLSPQLSWGNHGIWPQTDYSGIDDQTEVWWDPEATGPDEIGNEGTGMWTYANGGTRYLPGEWPDEAPTVFEDDPDPVTIYTDLPEGITLPEYEPLPPPDD